MGRLLVLCWHNVRPTWAFPFHPDAGVDGLGSQLRFLDRVANFVQLHEALAKLRSGERLPPRAVAVTFDDGYRDNAATAVPLLERMGVPATFFVVPDFVDGLADPWWEVLAWAIVTTTRRSLECNDSTFELAAPDARARAVTTVSAALKTIDADARDAEVGKIVDQLEPAGDWRSRVGFADWDEVRGMGRNGFTIGSHSARHVILSRETAAAQTLDIGRARRRIRDASGADAAVLAYPNGTVDDYTDATITAARAAGHEFAVTTTHGLNTAATDPFRVRRFVIYPEQGVRGLTPVLRYGLDSLRRRRTT
ncbi:MAG: polysaccharide deacetylase family protein [Acidimicrobiia bacterium]